MGDTIEKKRAIIFAGGEILNYAVVKSIVLPDDLIICADSGYLHCEKMGIQPDFLVGDFDSLKEIPKDIPKISLPEDKNYTDTTFALESAIHQGCNSVVLVGMLGGRLDHSFANIQSLVYCSLRDIDCYILDGVTQVFCVHSDGSSKVEFSMQPREQHYFSLIAYSESCTGVSIENAKYLLDNHTLHNDIARAVSNEFIGEEVKVSLGEGILLVMLTPKI